ncbi:MAG: hypothetical protein JXA69_02820 [Phycisphaerae bacterium]|nr:hypothetical protein [Phycisphaerae bacterium]
MKPIHQRATWISIILFALLSAQGCPPPTAPPTDTTDTTDINTDNTANDTLTTPEHNAVESALAGTQSLSTASGTAQNGTRSEGLSVQLRPAATVGICPTVTTQLQQALSLEFSVMIDYGTGCTPYYWPDTTFAGSASGTISQQEKTLALTFNDLACDTDTLSGTVNAEWDRTTSEVRIDGDWNLTWASPVTTTTTSGSGTCTYDLTDYVTSIPEFYGTVSDTLATGAWTMTATDIVMSFYNTGSYIPYSGTLMLEGTGIRTIIVRFNASSPTTGDVEVSITGAAFITINLWTFIGAPTP